MHWSVYGVLAVALVAFRILAARPRKPNLQTERASMSMGAIVPVYNEDPEILSACLVSLVGQGLSRIVVVDDGSTNDAVNVVTAWWGAPPFELVRFDTNLGKRAALVAGVEMLGDVDLVVTIDSDTIVGLGAIAELADAFVDPTVLGATGLVRAANHDANLLTRMIDLRYVQAFLLERAAQSAFGSVLCACGSLAAWRGDWMRANVSGLVTQRFLGASVTTGDDRHLTNMALMTGRVCLVPTALARTYVPSRVTHWLRQQLRWARSFVRETIWCLGNVSLKRAPWWLAVVEASSWLLMGGGLTWLTLNHLNAGMGLWVAAAVVMAWARSVYAFKEVGWLTLVLGPLYAVVHLFLLLPIRLVALVTIRERSWMTRKGVEVTESNLRPTSPATPCRN